MGATKGCCKPPTSRSASGARGAVHRFIDAIGRIAIIDLTASKAKKRPITAIEVGAARLRRLCGLPLGQDSHRDARVSELAEFQERCGNLC